MLYLLDSHEMISLTDEEREELRLAVAAELCESGLKDDDEPNERGLALEVLIDLLGKA